ncbi:dnaJ homolog subfamily C member 14 [Pseudophryne corroboree]|uniref:dnaJ homolog subfamily C member 14 n=1 Tax=Pseudophryne corroboree TaxID=495146 RepID=UPI003081E44D
MEKRMRRSPENREAAAAAAVYSLGSDAQERNAAHFPPAGNSCSLPAQHAEHAAVREGAGAPDPASGRYQTFFVPMNNCFHGFEKTSQEMAGDVWTREFLADHTYEEEVITDCFDGSKPQKETASCMGRESPQPFGSDCECIRDSIGSVGGTYSGISDHNCSQDCPRFSCYQAQSLEGDEGEDEDGGKLVEEDSWKASGGRRGRRGKTRNYTRDESRRDGRQPPSSSKHKLGRKKSHGDGRHQIRSLVPQPLLQFSNYCIRVLIDLVLLIGECVESLGMLLYIRLWLPARDLGSLKIQFRTFGMWLQHRTKDFWVLVCSCGLWILRVLKMLCALLFLLFMLSVRCSKLCWQYIKKSVDKVGADSNWRSWLSTKLHMIRALVTQSRTFRYLINLFRKWTGRFWPSKLRTDKKNTWASPGSAGGRFQPRDELERLLTMADIPEEDLNPFQVLGVEMDASETELKKAYRQLAVLVHPDKNSHPRAEDAFKVLRAAWDTVSNPDKRKEYELKRMSETELAKSMNEFLTKLQDDLKDAMNSMMCSKCQGKHRRFEIDRDPASARYCAECGKMHSAEEGDFWAESSMLGLKITYFAMMQGKVFDITEWAGCQRVGITPDTHRVPYHISFGSRNPPNPGRQRAPSESSPTSVADLQNLLNRIFQGSPGQMPNGNIFPSPQQPSQGAPSPSGPSKPDPAPKSETKSKRKKKMRRPVQR